MSGGDGGIVLNPIASLALGGSDGSGLENANAAPAVRQRRARSSVRGSMRVELSRGSVRRKSSMLTGSAIMDLVSADGRQGGRGRSATVAAIASAAAFTGDNTGPRLTRARAATQALAEQPNLDVQQAIDDIRQQHLRNVLGNVDEELFFADGRQEQQVIYSLSEVTHALLPVLKRFGFRLLILMLSTATLAICRSVMPRLVSELYDHASRFYSLSTADFGVPAQVLAPQKQEAASETKDALFRFCLTTFIQAVVVFVDTYVENVATVRMQLHVSRIVMARVMRKTIGFFANFSPGELTERTFRESNVLVSLYTVHFPVLFCSALKAGYGIYECMQISPVFLLVALASRPFCMVLTAVGAAILQARSKRLTDLQGDVLNCLQDTFSCARRVITANGRMQSLRRYVQKTFGFESYIVQTTTLSALIGGSCEAISLGGEVLFTWYGTNQILQAKISLGQFIAFRMYSDLVIGAFNEFLDAYSSLAEMLGATARVVHLMVDEEDHEPVLNEEFKRCMGADSVYSSDGRDLLSVLREGSSYFHADGLDVQFQNVTFAYPLAPARPVLSDLSLHVESGGRVTLVGTSGGGKSTVGALLLRLYDVHKNNGAVLLGNSNVLDQCPFNLRQRVCCVPQEPLLFAESVRFNICYGLMHPLSDERVERAARFAHAHEFISSLPKGYDTLVGNDPGSVTLSTGQAQRVVIASLLARQPGAAVLDEFTSALDNVTEHKVAKGVRECLGSSCTLIFITHRFELIQPDDRVVCVSGGKVTDDGKFEDLKQSSSDVFRELLGDSYTA